MRCVPTDCVPWLVQGMYDRIRHNTQGRDDTITPLQMIDLHTTEDRITSPEMRREYKKIKFWDFRG